MVWKPEMSGAWVTYSRIGFGHTIYALYVPNHVFPIGLVWGVGSRKVFFVAGSFVEPWARRCGVCSKIIECIFIKFATISTQHGSKDGGHQFMKAKQCKQNKDLDCFYIKRKGAKHGTDSGQR